MRVLAVKHIDNLPSFANFAQKGTRMICVDKLYLELGTRVVLRDISFVIADGEKIGLVGHNGAGKTSLLKILAGLIAPDRGKLQVSGRRASKISYVPQYLSLDNNQSEMDVLSYMLEGRGLLTLLKQLHDIEQHMEETKDPDAINDLIEQHQNIQQQYFDLEGYVAEDRVIEILSGIGLNWVDLDQAVSSLSGGQKSRLAIARILFEDSDVLLLDEPTNHMDAEAVDWLGRYLAKSAQTVIAVSHLATFLDQFVERILYLERQTSTVESFSGNFSQMILSRQNRRITTERDRLKTAVRIRKLKEYIRTVPLSKSGIKHSREKELERLESTMPTLVTEREIMVRFSPRVTLTKNAISASNLTKSFGDHRVLSGVSLIVEPHDRLGIVGVNGAGKTTLLRILAGATKPDSGRVDKHSRIELGWYEQEQEGLHEELSVLEEAKLASAGMSEQQIRATLAHFLLADKVQQTVSTLSRGERNRLVMCKLMLTRPNLLLLDEPTNHLDRPTQVRLKAALADYVGSIIIVSHDLEFLEGIGVEWVLHLPQGKLVPLSRFISEGVANERLFTPTQTGR